MTPKDKAKKFMRIADEALNALESVLRCKTGTPSHVRAQNRYEAANIAYWEARRELEKWIREKN